MALIVDTENTFLLTGEKDTGDVELSEPSKKFYLYLQKPNWIEGNGEIATDNFINTCKGNMKSVTNQVKILWQLKSL